MYILQNLQIDFFTVTVLSHIYYIYEKVKTPKPGIEPGSEVRLYTLLTSALAGQIPSKYPQNRT
jgi:hypothetical protein